MLFELNQLDIQYGEHQEINRDSKMNNHRDTEKLSEFIISTY